MPVLTSVRVRSATDAPPLPQSLSLVLAHWPSALRKVGRDMGATAWGLPVYPGTTFATMEYDITHALAAPGMKRYTAMVEKRHSRKVNALPRRHRLQRSQAKSTDTAESQTRGAGVGGTRWNNAGGDE